MVDTILGRIKKAWRGITEPGSEVGELDFKPDLPDSQIHKLKDQMEACLKGVGGEVSARRRAAELGRAYIALNDIGRERFLTLMAKEFGPNKDEINEAAQKLIDSDEDLRGAAEKELKAALVAPQHRLLTQFNALPDGVKFLVDMRAELLTLAKKDKDIKALEQDLKNLLISWFDVGFLELRRITWNSPAELLEKLIAYEAVHAIQSWDDLKNRLDSDRRCFAFFHPRMPDEPLIFVEVALVSGMSGNVHALLDEDAPVLDPVLADTAIFYSISNAQQGLAGISFGNFLIKKVVDRLSRDFPNLNNFATLSPVPGFKRWLDKMLAEGEPDLLLPQERDVLKNLNVSPGGKGSLKAVLELEDWYENPEISTALQHILMRLCARYLMNEKRGQGRTMDPVAHFHLTNGARMERLNWLADVSVNGVKQSAGMMINYRYVLREIDSNHEAYSGNGKVKASSSFKALLKP